MINFNEEVKLEKIMECAYLILEDILEREHFIFQERYIWHIGNEIRERLFENTKSYETLNAYQEMFFGINVDIRHNEPYILKLYKEIS